MIKLVITKTKDNYFFSYEKFNLISTEAPLPTEYITNLLELENYVDGLKTSQEKAFDFIVAKATDTEKLGFIDVYPSFEIGRSYIVGNEFKYEDNLYKVVQAHTSQADWLPNILPALYTKIALPNIIPAFVQPTGSQDAYQIGNKVIFETLTYESLINANTWSPTAYPTGWKLI